MKAMVLSIAVMLGVAGSFGCSKPDRLDTSEVTTTSGNLTPLDQGNSRQDRRITAALRQNVMANDALSIDGKNVQIITRDGVITLKGGVKSEQERAIIIFAATSTPGAVRVDDQLTLEAPPMAPVSPDKQ